MPEQNLKTVQEQIKWIQNNIELTRWNPKDYSKFGTRPIGQILESGHTNYMNSCMELTSALAYKLKEAGFEITLVVQEHVGGHTRKPTLHFAIELKADGKIYAVEFRTNKNAIIHSGKFDPKKARPELEHLQLTRCKIGRLTQLTTPLQMIGVPNWEKIGSKFKHVTFKHLRASERAMTHADSPKLCDSSRIYLLSTQSQSLSDSDFAMRRVPLFLWLFAR